MDLQTSESTLLNDLQKLRENILGIFFFNYAIGYVSFSIYCYNNDLGNISAFDLQYFIAGIVPTLIILFGLWLYRSATPDSITNFKLKLEEPPATFFWVIRLFIINIIYFSIAFYFYIVFRAFTNKVFFEAMLYIVVFIPITLGIISLPLIIKPDNVVPPYGINFLPFTKIIESKLLVNYAKTYKTNFIIFSSIIIASYYVYVYPNLPQELGGIKPKTAIIHSNKMVFPADNNRIKADSTNQLTVTVYYSNSSVIICRTNRSLLLEINRSNVTYIEWLY